MQASSTFIPPSPHWVLAFQNDLTAWYGTCARDLPWRRTRDPYRIWISEIMLQQTQVDTVIPYYQRFVDALPTVEALAAVEEERLLKLWEGLGYYSRARNLKRAAEAIVTRHGGRLPSDVTQLLELPGIGLYTAGAVASIAYGKPHPAVDGNVIRVYSRLLAVDENSDSPSGKRLFQQLGTALVDHRDPSSFNQAVMELGALICSPKAPKCDQCPVSSHCRAYAAGTPTDYPVRSPKRQSPTLRWIVTVYCRPGEIFLVPRSEDALLKGLWGFPMTELPNDADWLPEDRGPVKHVFTHQTWLMAVRVVEDDGSEIPERLFPEGQWADAHRLTLLPLPKAFRCLLPLLEDVLHDL